MFKNNVIAEVTQEYQTEISNNLAVLGYSEGTTKSRKI
jgi:hypothetical protein